MSALTPLQVVAEDRALTACYRFQQSWWYARSGDMLQQLVELQCSIDDAIDLIADVHA